MADWELEKEIPGEVFSSNVETVDLGGMTPAAGTTLAIMSGGAVEVWGSNVNGQVCGFSNDVTSPQGMHLSEEDQIRGQWRPLFMVNRWWRRSMVLP